MSSFGLNTYGTAYTTGKRYSSPTDGGPMGWFMGRVELVHKDKDGKAIGVRGENGHPHCGTSPTLIK